MPYLWDEPWYDEAEAIAAKAESTGESQLAWNIAALVDKHVKIERERNLMAREKEQS